MIDLYTAMCEHLCSVAVGQHISSVEGTLHMAIIDKVFHAIMIWALIAIVLAPFWMMYCN